MTTEHTIPVDLDGLIDLSSVECTFDVETEEYPAEPYSWGGSRGTETEITATLTGVKLGDLTITRDQAVLMFGIDAIDRAEKAADEGVEA